MRLCTHSLCVEQNVTGGSFSIKVIVIKEALVGYHVYALGDCFEGRWRHSTTLINDRWLVIIGGCTVSGRVFSDILLLDSLDWTMKKVLSVQVLSYE